jgi:hypothetical protein
LRTTIPIAYHPVHVAKENRIMCLIEEAGLFPSLLYFKPKSVVGLTQLICDPPCGKAEPGDDRRPYHENQRVGDLPCGDLERVEGRCEKVDETRDRKQNRDHGRANAAVPAGDGDRETEHRRRWGAEVVMLQRERRSDHHCDGDD